MKDFNQKSPETSYKDCQILWCIAMFVPVINYQSLNPTTSSSRVHTSRFLIQHNIPSLYVELPMDYI